MVPKSDAFDISLLGARYAYVYIMDVQTQSEVDGPCSSSFVAVWRSGFALQSIDNHVPPNNTSSVHCASLE